MELQQLRYFLAVVETGGFSRAAERMRVAQPSLSQQIIKLEEEVGQPLFDRLSRGVVTTEAGRRLLPFARRILADVSDAQRSVNEQVDDASSRLSIGLIPTIAPYVIQPLLAAFAAEHPQISVAVVEDVTENLVRSLENGEIDLVVVSTCRQGSGLHREVWAREPLVAALPEKHRLARRRTLALGDLAGESFQLLHETHCLSRQIGQWCRRCGIRPESSPPVLQLATILAMVATGRKVSLIPALAAASEPPRGCVFRAFSDPVPEREINVLRNPSRYSSKAAAAMMTIGRRVIAAAVEASA